MQMAERCNFTHGERPFKYGNDDGGLLGFNCLMSDILQPTFQMICFCLLVNSRQVIATASRVRRRREYQGSKGNQFEGSDHNTDSMEGHLYIRSAV